MKRNFLLFLAISVSFSMLAGCGTRRMTEISVDSVHGTVAEMNQGESVENDVNQGVSVENDVNQGVASENEVNQGVSAEVDASNAEGTDVNTEDAASANAEGTDEELEKGETAEAVKSEENANAKETDGGLKKDSDTVDSMREIYDDVINDYIAFYRGEKTLNQTCLKELIGDNSSILNYGTYDNPWLGSFDGDTVFDPSNAGYMYSDQLFVDARFYDANGDGIDELFIVEADDNFYQYGMIHDVWAIVDGKPKYVSYFDARYELVLHADGTLMEFASSGWSSNTLLTLSFNANGTFTEIDRLETIPYEGYYYCQHNGVDISEDEYNALFDVYFNLARMNLTELDGIRIASWKK